MDFNVLFCFLLIHVCSFEYTQLLVLVCLSNTNPILSNYYSKVIKATLQMGYDVYKGVETFMVSSEVRFLVLLNGLCCII